MSDFNSRSIVRFRSNTVALQEADTTPRDVYEILLSKTPGGKMSPSVRIGRGKSQYSESVPIGMVIDRTASAVNATAVMTVAQVITGLITSTSAAAVSATFPSATAIASEIGARAGTTMDIVVDNVAGANAVTLVVGAGITAKGSLVVATGASIRFTLQFTSTTAALLVREVAAGETVVTDTISEATGAAGVTVDGALIKDSSIALADGTVGNLAVKLGADVNNGLYGVSDTQLGIAVEGALVGGADTLGLFTGNIAEQIGGVGVTVDGALLKDGFIVNKPTPVAINATAAATAAEIVSGYITSTSAAATSITTPTATAIAALIGAVQGNSFELSIDNSAGASTVTLVLDASIAVVTPAITGGNTLTVSTANAIGIFRIVFTSATAAKIFRIA